ncbi:MAG: HK97 gp10 family phage protein [Anaerotignaceae bacterium]
MARWGRVDYRQLVRLRDKLEKLQSADIPKFQEDMVKELAARLLRKVVQNTPTISGTLRRNWAVGNVVKIGNIYEVEVFNNTEYAPYVEYGHRTANHNGWVQGKFMLTISEKELQQDADRIVQQRLERLLRGVFDGQ